MPSNKASVSMVRLRSAFVAIVVVFVIGLIVGLNWKTIQENLEQKYREELPKRQGRVITARTFDVLRVINGDTLAIVYDGMATRVRLLDIDAPEKGDAGGPEATPGLRDMVDGRTIRIELTDPSGRKRDDFGRLLCKVYLDDLDVGAELIRLGRAKPWR